MEKIPDDVSEVFRLYDIDPHQEYRDNVHSISPADYVGKNVGFRPLSSLITSEHIKNIDEERHILPGLIIQGHTVVFIAKPGSGKTTLVQHLCDQMHEQGETIDYYNLDGNSHDIKRHFGIAEYNVFNNVLTGNSVQQTIEHLKWLSEQSDMQHRVVVLDTLKHCIDVINKAELKEFMQLCRRVTMTGATVIVIGHANKALDINGDLVFEGTNDLLSECDDLYYMYYDKKDDAGYQIISIDPSPPGKARGHLDKHSWKMDLNTRKLVEIEYIDVREDRHEIQEKVSAARVRENIAYQLASKICVTPNVWHEKYDEVRIAFHNSTTMKDMSSDARSMAWGRVFKSDKLDRKEGNLIKYTA